VPQQDENGREPSGLIGSAQRALRVLEIVAAEGDGITAKAIARRADYKLSTTYHLLNTLVHEGYLIRLGHGRGFGLGYKIGGLYQRLCEELDVNEAMRDELRLLHQRGGAAAYFTVFRDTQVVVAAVADSAEFPRAGPVDFGFHEAAHATAFGKVMLASLAARERIDYLAAAGMPRLTARTRVRMRDLEAELAQISKAGLSVEIEEFRPDIACVSAPVLGEENRVIGAVSFSVPAKEFYDRRRALEHTVRTGAIRFTRMLRGTNGLDVGLDAELNRR
jgi:DNA-binding IclR family transcriptional regulator